MFPSNTPNGYICLIDHYRRYPSLRRSKAMPPWISRSSYALLASLVRRLRCTNLSIQTFKALAFPSFCGEFPPTHCRAAQTSRSRVSFDFYIPFPPSRSLIGQLSRRRTVLKGSLCFTFSSHNVCSPGECHSISFIRHVFRFCGPSVRFFESPLELPFHSLPLIRLCVINVYAGRLV